VAAAVALGMPARSVGFILRRQASPWTEKLKGGDLLILLALSLLIAVGVFC